MLDSTVRPPQLSDYGALIRRQWWLVALAFLIGIYGGFWYNVTQPKIFTSTTQVLVTPTGVDDAVSTNSRTRTEINLDTEAQLLTSTAVTALAADMLGPDAGRGDLADSVRVSVPPNTEVMTIKFEAATADAARDGANAFADAYLSNRAQVASEQIAARQDSRQAQVRARTESLQEITASLGTLVPGSAERAVAEAQVRSLSAEIAVLTAEANELESRPVTPGRTITEATVPRRPSSPVLLVNLAGGAMLGLLLGCGVALLRQRSDRNMRNSEDVTKQTGLPVLASIPESSGIWPPETTSAVGSRYVRLRNMLTARLAPDARIILIAGIDGDGSEVADNLAATLARTGAEVVLVSTHARSTTAQRLGLSRRWPGLSEVLGRQATTSAALQAPAGLETLRVLTPGQDPERAAGLLETRAAEDLLSELGRMARYVILEAPPTASSGQAQTLAAFADTALVVIQTSTTSAEDVNDAVEQFMAMRTPLIGSVLVSPGRQSRRQRRRTAPIRSKQPSETSIGTKSETPTPSAEPSAGLIEGSGQVRTSPSDEAKDPNQDRAKTGARGDGHVGRDSVSGAAETTPIPPLD